MPRFQSVCLVDYVLIWGQGVYNKCVILVLMSDFFEVYVTKCTLSSHESYASIHTFNAYFKLNVIHVSIFKELSKWEIFLVTLSCNQKSV